MFATRHGPMYYDIAVVYNDMLQVMRLELNTARKLLDSRDRPFFDSITKSSNFSELESHLLQVSKPYKPQ